MMTGDSSEEQRVQAAVQRHRLEMDAFWAEKAISAVLADPQVQRVRAQVLEAETQFGLELRACLQPFQDRYDQAVRDGNTAVLIGICPGKHGRWGRICVLDEGHAAAIEEPHWGHNSDGQPIAWVGSAPDDW